MCCEFWMKNSELTLNIALHYEPSLGKRQHLEYIVPMIINHRESVTIRTLSNARWNRQKVSSSLL